MTFIAAFADACVHATALMLTNEEEKECKGEECFAVCRRVCDDSCKIVKRSIRQAMQK